MPTHCFFSSISDVLSRKSIHCGEMELFFLSGGLDIRIGPDFEKGDLQACHFQSYDISLKRLAQRLSFAIQMKWNTEKHKEKDVFRLLEPPFIICIDQSLLRHHTVAARILLFHFLVATKVNERENTIELFDPYVVREDGSVEIYQGTVDLKEIQDQCYCAITVSPSTPVRITNEALRNSVVEALRNVYDVNPKGMTGNAALHRFFIQYHDLFPYNLSENVTTNMILKFKTHYLHILDYTIEYIEKYRINRSFILEIEDIKRKWQALFITMFMLYHVSDKELQMHRIADTGARIVEMQENMFQRLIVEMQ